MAKYSIGIDFGTLSARALLINLESGQDIAASEFKYPHAVMKCENFENKTLGKTDAFQHPQDYLDALSYIVKDVLYKGNVIPDDIVGVGIDFTSCTMLAVKNDGTPLCFLEEFKNEPHAYVKLWKHHSAQKEADKITELAKIRNESWLDLYGGKISSEWLFPKIYETLNKAPNVFEAADRFIEAADWLVWMLTGKESHSSCMAGYKGLWNKISGYPSNNFWKSLDCRLNGIVGTKVSENVIPTGSVAGNINGYASELTGLCTGTTVAVPIIDAHAALVCAGIVDPGKLMIIMGTSSCHIVMSDRGKSVSGICGSVEDGIVPGYIAHEAGQACVGDSFDWFMKNCLCKKYVHEADTQGKNIFEYTEEKAATLKVGESGLLVLDWFNGNRTPYADYDLTGAIIGLTLKTKPEEIYRAIIESTAFGTKQIVELYENSGVKVEEIYAAGGISSKSPFIMQIYADVLGKAVKITESKQAGAKGSAILASVAGGYFDSLDSAARILADNVTKLYTPIAENTEKYNKIYCEYKKFSHFFAIENRDIMKNIKDI